MRKIIHILIIVFVVFSISVETYIYLNTSLTIDNYPTSKLNRLIYYYSYFTVLSNVSVGLSSFLLLKKPTINGLGFRVLRLDGLICITITCIVYNLILRDGHLQKGITSITNELLHIIIPILAIISWLLYDPKPRINKKVILISILPPLFYIIYILIRGEITHLYPYPFLNVDKIGYSHALMNIGVILIFFLFLQTIFYYTEKIFTKIAPKK